MSAKNQIQSLQFQLEIPSRNHNKNIQDKVVDIFNYSLQPMLDRLLSSFPTAGRDIGFESIELTLEPIDIDSFEKELLEKIEVALKRFFEVEFERLSPLKSISTPPVQHQNSGNTSQLYGFSKTSVIAYFLKHGHYPWWEKELNTTLSQRWRTALRKEEKQFTTQLFILGKKRYVLKRMAHQLSDDVLRSTITTVEPGGAGNIFSFHDQLKEQQQKKPISGGATSKDFSKAIWEFTLTYLFVEMGTAFNQKMFLKSHIKQMAQHYNIEYKMVLKFLNKGLAKLAQHSIKKEQLFSALKELEEEQLFAEKPAKITPPTEDVVQLLKKILKRSSHTQEDRDYITSYLGQLRRNRDKRKLLPRRLNEREFRRLVGFIVPQEKELIDEYLSKAAHAYKAHPVKSSTRSDFIIHLRGLVLNYLLLENTTVFSRKAFLKAQVAGIAKHYTMQEDEVLQFLASGFGGTQASNTDKTGLFSVLRSLMEESGAKTEAAVEPLSLYREESSVILLRPLLSLSSLSAKEHQLLRSVLEAFWKSTPEPAAALPDAMLLKIISHLIPEHRLFIKEYTDQIALLRSKVFPKSSPDAFKNRMWFFIVEALLTTHRSGFSDKVFIEDHLRKLASQFSIEYVAVLFHFIEHTGNLQKSNQHSTLKDHLETLYLEHHVTPAVFKQIAKNTDFSTYIPQVVYFLQFGSYPPGSPHINKSVLEQVFLELLLHYKDKLAEALKAQGASHEENMPLLGLNFFPENTIPVWEEFKKERLTSGAKSAEGTTEKTLTDTQYKNILAFYLKTGALPWWAGEIPMKKVIKHLFAKPEMFSSFIRSQKWTMNTVQRIGSFFNADESTQFLQLVTSEKHSNAGKAINDALNDITNNISSIKLDDAFLLFALQHLNQSLSPEHFIKLYLERFCFENHLDYNACVIKFIPHLKDKKHIDIAAFFEDETVKFDVHSEDHQKQLQEYITEDLSEKQLEKLSEFIKKQDKHTAVKLLSDWAATRKKAFSNAVVHVFLTHLHKKDHEISEFFSEIAQLREISVIRNAYPEFYDEVLQFYINYIGIKKIAAFDFNEFIMRWFAYLERKDKAKAIKLARLLKTHLKKHSPRFSKFILYFSEAPPAKTTKVKDDIPVDTLPDIDKVKDLEEDPADELTDKVLIFNSGLTLLWPFLSHCFKILNYTVGNNFINLAMKERAVYLLHYIATGIYEDVSEEQLVINKILCGFPVTRPLSSTMVPTPQEKELTESMLKAVIERWSKLGKTSIDGLRGSYIIREGYLEELENGYQLQVEKKGYDILLDYLPWKLELIKLPWMIKPLYVAWNQ